MFYFQSEGINLYYTVIINYNDEMFNIVNEKIIPVFHWEVLYAWMYIRSHVMYRKSRSVKV